MLYGPLEYGRKAEELLWRKVYYDVIQLMKHNRKVTCCHDYLLGSVASAWEEPGSKLGAETIPLTGCVEICNIIKSS